MAKIEKKTSIICNDWIAYTNIMDNETAGILFKAILAVRNWQEPPDLPDSLRFVMAHILDFWQEQDQKYQDTIVARNQENGKKGGRPPSKKPKKPSGINKTQANPKKPSEPNKTLTETDTVTDKKENKKNNTLTSITKLTVLKIQKMKFLGMLRSML